MMSDDVVRHSIHDGIMTYGSFCSIRKYIQTIYLPPTMVIVLTDLSSTSDGIHSKHRYKNYDDVCIELRVVI
jgi:hypothetical protein